MAKEIYANDELVLSNDCPEQLALCPVVKNIERNNFPHAIEKVGDIDIVKVKVFYQKDNAKIWQTICNCCREYRKGRQ